MNMNDYKYIYIYIDICSAKPRSRHRATSMSVAKQKPKYMIRKCIKNQWRAAKGRNKQAKGSQLEPKGMNER